MIDWVKLLFMTQLIFLYISSLQDHTSTNFCMKVLRDNRLTVHSKQCGQSAHIINMRVNCQFATVTILENAHGFKETPHNTENLQDM